MGLTQDERDRIVGPYQRWQAQGGIRAEVCGWGSGQSQRRRFRVLLDLLNGATDSTLLDAGCGTGGLYHELVQQGWCGVSPIRQYGTRIDYVGWDLLPEHVAIAQERYPRGTFAVRDVLVPDEERFDYVVASGLFAIKLPSGIDHVHRLIEVMWTRCHKGVVFNVLVDRAIEQEPDHLYVDVPDLLRFCESFAWKMIVRADYAQHDVTIAMYRL
jgi:SAM-dependent methyltransferase